MTTPVPAETLAAFDKKAQAKIAPLDYVVALQLKSFSLNEQEAAAREFRIRGIDTLIKDLKQGLQKDEATALNRYLKQCPRIDELTQHILEYKEAQRLLEAYIPKLHIKIQDLEQSN